MRYAGCNILCDPDHDVHYLGAIAQGVPLRDAAKHLDEFMPYGGRKCCGCGGVGKPHIGFGYPCPASTSGGHNFKEVESDK